jgi:hypothetical protein
MRKADTDFTGWIPDNKNRINAIIEDLKLNPNKCRGYVARILRMSPSSKNLGDGVYWQAHNHIAYYVKQYRDSDRRTILNGYRSFDIEKLAAYLVTKKYKI